MTTTERENPDAVAQLLDKAATAFAILQGISERRSYSARDYQAALTDLEAVLCRVDALAPPDLVTAYIECALWSTTGDDGEPLDATRDASDIGDDGILTLTRDCHEFWQACHAFVGEGCERRAGHDLWLTRNSHDAGFWDGDWPAADGSIMCQFARAAGARDIYEGDDGKLYVS